MQIKRFKIFESEIDFFEENIMDDIKEVFSQLISDYDFHIGKVDVKLTKSHNSSETTTSRQFAKYKITTIPINIEMNEIEVDTISFRENDSRNPYNNKYKTLMSEGILKVYELTAGIIERLKSFDIDNVYHTIRKVDSKIQILIQVQQSVDEHSNKKHMDDTIKTKATDFMYAQVENPLGRIFGKTMNQTFRKKAFHDRGYYLYGNGDNVPTNWSTIFSIEGKNNFIIPLKNEMTKRVFDNNVPKLIKRLSDVSAYDNVELITIDQNEAKKILTQLHGKGHKDVEDIFTGSKAIKIEYDKEKIINNNSIWIKRQADVLIKIFDSYQHHYMSS